MEPRHNLTSLQAKVLRSVLERTAFATSRDTAPTPHRLKLKGHSPYGFDASFNPTYPDTSTNLHGWVSSWIFGLNQGPILLMIENFQSQLIWEIIRQCPYIEKGL